MGFLKFKVKSQDNNARTGLLKLKHGIIKTLSNVELYAFNFTVSYC